MVIDGVAVEVAGTGPPLVLLHGILQDGRAWRAQVEGLRDSFTVVTWDAPGCGRSADPPSTWRIGAYADCLAGVIGSLGLVDPVVGGLSWGGTLALEFQRRHPGVASALVLSATYAGWAGSLSAEECAGRLASCLAQSAMPPPEVVAQWMPGLVTSAASPALVEEIAAMMVDFHPSGFRTMAHAVAEADLRAALSGIEVPVLLLYGDDDRRAPVETVGAALARQLSDARLVVIPAAGHLCNAEQPEAFNRAIREFAAG